MNQLKDSGQSHKSLCEERVVQGRITFARRLPHDISLVGLQAAVDNELLPLIALRGETPSRLLVKVYYGTHYDTVLITVAEPPIITLGTSIRTGLSR